MREEGLNIPRPTAKESIRDGCCSYGDDDWNPEDPEDHKLFTMIVAGSDYYLSSHSREDVMPLMVRVRTSGSSDPRNLKVCLALRQLWEAMQGIGE